MNHAGQDRRGSETFRGPWWRYPPLLTAIVAGVIAGSGFILSHAGIIAHSAENWFYWLAIPLGAWHWTSEGLQELFSQGESGINVPDDRRDRRLRFARPMGRSGRADDSVCCGRAWRSTPMHARARQFARCSISRSRKRRVIADGHETMVPAEQLRPSDVFRVLHGRIASNRRDGDRWPLVRR